MMRTMVLKPRSPMVHVFGQAQGLSATNVCVEPVIPIIINKISHNKYRGFFEFLSQLKGEQSRQIGFFPNDTICINKQTQICVNENTSIKGTVLNLIQKMSSCHTP